MAARPNPAINNHQVVGSGVAETVPTVENRAGLAGEVQAAPAQLASWTVPTFPLLLLTSMIPPESVNPWGGKPLIPVKKNARAGAPDWFATFDVRKRTSVELGLTPVQLTTLCPQMKE
jgi:hypothetical protein